MLKDRAFAIMNTAMFAPRYLRHFVTNTRVIAMHADGAIEAQANYILLETLHDNPKGSIHQAGAYRDVFERQPDGRLLLRRRVCVYDNLLVPNALVLPV